MHILSRNDKTKCVYFMIKDEQFFGKYMTIWEKVSSVIEKKLIVNFYIIKHI